ncbi:MAG: hypothetical protein WCF67_15050 [Chitinophagaceae bacterium]
MKKPNKIQFVLGWVLLLLFTFSITPRQLLHDVLAHHTDLSDTVPGNSSAFIEKGFSCDRLNLVAESPFTEVDKITNKLAVIPFTEFVDFFDHSYTPQAFFLLSLRGPPCM